MPEFVYAGQLPRSYTELRDLNGEITGTVEHGDKRDLAEAPPDGLWLAGDAKIAPAWDGVSADMYRLPESRGDEAEGDEADDSEPASTPPAPAGRVTAARASLAGAASGEKPDTTTPAADGQKDEG